LFYELTRAEDARGVVVLCDGIGCDGYVWKYLRPVLAEHYDILHWHYPGHGRSPAPRPEQWRLSIADLADDLSAVLDDAEIDRAIVFGHSMGVQVSLETYRRHRDRVAALGLFCGAPGNPLRTFRRTEALERLLPGVRAAVSRAPRLAARLARSLIPTGLSYAIAAQVEVNGRLLDQADFMPYLRGLADVDPTLFLAMLAEAGRHSARDLLPYIEVPALVVAGTRDGFTPPELSTAMAEEIPGAELIEVVDGSHTAPLERPHFVNAAVVTFLARLA
jgi:pimeloyl-ACP methyl ester carboxylesterase